jgi:hypothetical protein
MMRGFSTSFEREAEGGAARNPSFGSKAMAPTEESLSETGEAPRAEPS